VLNLTGFAGLTDCVNVDGKSNKPLVWPVF
jgi:hypothetical protein